MSARVFPRSVMYGSASELPDVNVAPIGQMFISTDTVPRAIKVSDGQRWWQITTPKNVISKSEYALSVRAHDYLAVGSGTPEPWINIDHNGMTIMHQFGAQNKIRWGNYINRDFSEIQYGSGTPEGTADPYTGDFYIDFHFYDYQKGAQGGSATAEIAIPDGTSAYQSIMIDAGTAPLMSRVQLSAGSIELAVDGTVAYRFDAYGPSSWLNFGLWVGTVDPSNIRYSVYVYSASLIPYRNWTVAKWYQTYRVSTGVNPSNYWNIYLKRMDSTGAAYNLDIISTSADSPNTWYNKTRSVGDAIGTGDYALFIDVVKSGTPGNISLVAPQVYLY